MYKLRSPRSVVRNVLTWYIHGSSIGRLLYTEYVIWNGADLRGSKCSQILSLCLYNELFPEIASLLSRKGSLFSSKSTRINVSQSFEDFLFTTTLDIL